MQLTDATTVVVDKVKYTTNVRLQLAEFMILKDDKNQIDHKTLQNSTQSINQSINQDFNSRWQTATRQGTYGRNKNKKYNDTQ